MLGGDSVCDPSIQEMESEGLGVKGLHHLHRKFLISLCYVRPCLCFLKDSRGIDWQV